MNEYSYSSQPNGGLRSCPLMTRAPSALRSAQMWRPSRSYRSTEPRARDSGGFLRLMVIDRWGRRFLV